MQSARAFSNFERASRIFHGATLRTRCKLLFIESALELDARAFHNSIALERPAIGRSECMTIESVRNRSSLRIVRKKYYIYALRWLVISL